LTRAAARTHGKPPPKSGLLSRLRDRSKLVPVTEQQFSKEQERDMRL
jgi:hypothetical protein